MALDTYKAVEAKGSASLKAAVTATTLVYNACLLSSLAVQRSWSAVQ